MVQIDNLRPITYVTILVTPLKSEIFSLVFPCQLEVVWAIIETDVTCLAANKVQNSEHAANVNNFNFYPCIDLGIQRSMTHDM